MHVIVSDSARPFVHRDVRTNHGGAYTSKIRRETDTHETRSLIILAPRNPPHFIPRQAHPYALRNGIDGFGHPRRQCPIGTLEKRLINSEYILDRWLQARDDRFDEVCTYDIVQIVECIMGCAEGRLHEHLHRDGDPQPIPEESIPSPPERIYSINHSLLECRPFSRSDRELTKQYTSLRFDEPLNIRATLARAPWTQQTALCTHSMKESQHCERKPRVPEYPLLGLARGQVQVELVKLRGQYAAVLLVLIHHSAILGYRSLAAIPLAAHVPDCTLGSSSRSQVLDVKPVPNGSDTDSRTSQIPFFVLPPYTLTRCFMAAADRQRVYLPVVVEQDASPPPLKSRKRLAQQVKEILAEVRQLGRVRTGRTKRES